MTIEYLWNLISNRLWAQSNNLTVRYILILLLFKISKMAESTIVAVVPLNSTNQITLCGRFNAKWHSQRGDSVIFQLNLRWSLSKEWKDRQNLWQDEIKFLQLLCRWLTQACFIWLVPILLIRWLSGGHSPTNFNETPG